MDDMFFDAARSFTEAVRSSVRKASRILGVAAAVALWSGSPACAQSPAALAVDRVAEGMDVRRPSDVPPGTPALLRLRILMPAEEIGGADADEFSPIDTLHKSVVESVFWGRRGVFRGTGLFRTDTEHPENDLRRLSRLRRSMLSIHQVMGLATVASMTATVVGGQLALDDRGSGLHKGSLPLTIGLYSTTAALALASPPKLIPSRGVDTITFHKYFAVLHVAGMILTPMLAPDDEGGSSSARGHQIAGYATYGAFTAGFLTVMLFR